MQTKQREDRRPRCRNCNMRIIKFPLWRGQEFDEPFSFDKIIWKNLWKMEMASFLLFATTLVWMFVYWHDTNMYQDIAEHPVQYCEEAGCYCGERLASDDIDLNSDLISDDTNTDTGVPQIRLPTG